MANPTTIATKLNQEPFASRIAQALDVFSGQVAADIASLFGGGAAGTPPVRTVRLAATTALPANVYNATAQTLTAASNGALSVDGEAVAVGDRILVAGEADAKNNGIYVVTAAGGASAKYVLTRAADANAAAEFQPGMLVVTGAEGTSDASAIFLLTAQGNIVLDGETGSSLTFSKAAATISYTAMQWRKDAADAQADSATAETVVGAVKGATVLSKVVFTPADVLVAAAAHNATITVNKRTAGGAAVKVAEATTALLAGGGTGDFVAFKPVTIPVITAAQANVLAADDVITVAITKTGNGVAVPAGVLSLFA